jgi:hypothetical protein
MADAAPEQPLPIVVILGLDSQNRAHAAAFVGPEEVTLAERAASAMNMHLLRIKGDQLHALVADVPKGQVYKSGNALTPLIKQSLYDQLVALGTAAGSLVEAAPASPSEGSATTLPDTPGEGTSEPPDGQAEASTPHLPTTLETVMVGSLIGVSEGRGEGWYEAIVVELAPADALEDDLLTCQYMDWPDYPRQVRRRADVALLPPSANIL